MSDSALRYVPIDTNFVPTEAAARRAEIELRRMLPRAESVASHASEQVTFVDCGENWEGVTCPHCNADAEGWWSDAMDIAAAGTFQDLVATAKCCGASVRLDQLHYGCPVAFGRFVLEAINPESMGLTKSQLETLSEKLGCRVREVRSHI